MLRLIQAAVPALALVGLLAASGARVATATLDDSNLNGSLSVFHGGRWVEWWRAERAPHAWSSPHPTVNSALAWRNVSDGVQWSELRLSAGGVAHRVRVIVVRLDPSRVRFRLESSWASGGAPDWSVGGSGDSALVSFNAGQFAHGTPWGWVMTGGRELQSPGRGSLSVGIAFDSSGALHWIGPERLGDRIQRRGAVEGFQSYPRLLDDGRVPEPLRVDDSGVDLQHRDARLAFGQTVNGSILIALTRYDGVGGVLDFVPFGLTTPEMAAVMGAIGARNAVMLDGGISSQLQIRDGTTVHRWRGLRRVPMGLVVTNRLN